MILFVLGQYAGAQYALPLFNRWAGGGPVPWAVWAHGPSARCLAEAGVDHGELDGDPAATAREVLRAAKPGLVVLSASAEDPFEREFVVQARAAGVPTARFLDMWANYGMRFRYGDEVILPDHVLAIDERCARELEAEGVPAGLITMVGQPYLEEVAAQAPAPGGEVLLPGQPVSKHLGRSLGYDESDFWDVATRGLALAGVEDYAATRHPGEDAAAPGPPASHLRDGRGLEDVRACHTVLGMFSMQMVVAHLWGRKVASVQPGLNAPDPCPLSRWGAVPLLQTPQEVAEFLRSPAAPGAGHDMRAALGGSLDRFEAFCLKACAGSA